jgi:hypothetical protein
LVSCLGPPGYSRRLHALTRFAMNYKLQYGACNLTRINVCWLMLGASVHCTSLCATYHESSCKSCNCDEASGNRFPLLSNPAGLNPQPTALTCILLPYLQASSRCSHGGSRTQCACRAGTTSGHRPPTRRAPALLLMWNATMATC